MRGGAHAQPAVHVVRQVSNVQQGARVAMLERAPEAESGGNSRLTAEAILRRP